MITTKQVNIYTETDIKGPRRRDGAFGYILEVNTQRGPATLTKIEQIENSTENQAELTALLGALKRLREKCKLTIYTESYYLAAAYIQGWLEKWKEFDWKNSKGKPIANKEEWQEIEEILNGHEFEFRVSEEHSYREWLKSEVSKKSKEEEK